MRELSGQHARTYLSAPFCASSQAPLAVALVGARAASAARLPDSLDCPVEESTAVDSVQSYASGQGRHAEAMAHSR